jgi:hypothetical protein
MLNISLRLWCLCFIARRMGMSLVMSAENLDGPSAHKGVLFATDHQTAETMCLNFMVQREGARRYFDRQVEVATRISFNGEGVKH